MFVRVMLFANIRIWVAFPMERLLFLSTYREMTNGKCHLVLFFLLNSQKVKKVFDKGQKVRYNLTIEKSKKSNLDVLCI